MLVLTLPAPVLCPPVHTTTQVVHTTTLASPQHGIHPFSSLDAPAASPILVHKQPWVSTLSSRQTTHPFTIQVDMQPHPHNFWHPPFGSLDAPIAPHILVLMPPGVEHNKMVHFSPIFLLFWTHVSVAYRNSNMFLKILFGNKIFILVRVWLSLRLELGKDLSGRNLDNGLADYMDWNLFNKCCTCWKSLKIKSKIYWHISWFQWLQNHPVHCVLIVKWLNLLPQEFGPINHWAIMPNFERPHLCKKISCIKTKKNISEIISTDKMKTFDTHIDMVGPF